jgi:hypothetical protein
VPPLTQRDREERARKAKLDDVEAQVSNGSLEIREMTDEERAKWARSPDDELPSRPGRRGSRSGD